MNNDTGIKRLILELLYRCIFVLSRLTPRRKIIFLESHPDFCDNPYELYRYFIRSGVNRSYHIIWLTGGDPGAVPPDDENVECIPIHPAGLWAKLRLRYLLCKAPAVVCSNRFFFPSVRGRHQLFVFLDHGSPLKDCKNVYTKFPPRSVYYISQADCFRDVIADQYGADPDKVVTTGLPRNDQLFGRYDSLRRLIPDLASYEKVIVWAPTFRYHESKTRVDCHSDMPLGIPIFYSEDALEKFNGHLARQNVLMLLKPHPAQDIERVVDARCSNIRVLFSGELTARGIQTNELLAQTDALITDYSSIYFDYLLLDRPVAITLDDYEQYKAELGFAFERPLDVLKGVYVRTEDEMYRFVDAVAAGRDEMREERNRVAAVTDQFHDAQSAKRVCDFILDGIRERA